MCRLVSLIAIAVLLDATLSVAVAAPGESFSPLPLPPASDRPFADVPRDHWAYEAVEELRKRGILRGYPPVQEPQTAPAKPAGRPGRKPAGRPATPR
jgi:hypothetical protein